LPIKQTLLLITLAIEKDSRKRQNYLGETAATVERERWCGSESGFKIFEGDAVMA
jgi:hypothetical protein